MSYILLNLTSEVISSFCIPANMLKHFSRKTNQQENEVIEKYGGGMNDLHIEPEVHQRMGKDKHFYLQFKMCCTDK